MLRELKKHKFAYSILVMALLTGIALFMGVWPNVMYQRIVIVFISMFYFIWGITTHIKTAYLTKQVVLEYLGVSFLGMCILLLITF